jgi:glutaredoxin 3
MNTMQRATFYHAGCPVCVSAEKSLAMKLDPSKVQLEVVHLGEDKSRIAAAREAGVKSVPALVMDDGVFHINFGAALDDLR